VPFGVLGVLALSAALQTYGPSLIPATGSDIPIIGYGVVLILVLLFLPAGLAGGAQRLWRAVLARSSPGRTARSPDAKRATRRFAKVEAGP
ncbi:MAG: hypothetical protein ACYDBS_07765, partial [Acidimicrobiales bacterium]